MLVFADLYNLSCFEIGMCRFCVVSPGCVSNSSDGWWLFQPSLSVLYMLSDGATHEAVHLLCRMLVFDPVS